MDIDTVLEKWNDAKNKIDLLESKIKKYKSAVAKEMDGKGVDKIASSKYSVTRRRTTRTTLSKDSVPSDIWKQYSTRSTYDAFFISEKK
jgi:hypothetical protein